MIATEKEIQELEEFYQSVSEEKFQLDDCSLITNSKRFVRTHIDAIKSNINNEKFKPYLDRLLIFKTQYQCQNLSQPQKTA